MKTNLSQNLFAQSGRFFKASAFLLLMTFALNSLFAQTGPGGVGTTNGTSSLKLWLKADAGTNTVTNGAAVSSWNDQSGSGFNAAQATGGNQPTYATGSINGQPAVTFNGSSSFMLVNPFPLFTSSTSPVSMFLVFLSTDGSQKFAIHQPQTNCSNNFELGVYAGTGSNNWGLHAGCGTSEYAPGVSDNNFNIMTLKLLSSGASPSNLQMRKNGTSLSMSGGWTSAGNYGFASRKLILGCRDDNNSNGYNSFLTGNIAEVIDYNTTVNTAQTILVENYLNAKYNITIAADKYAQPTAATYIKGVCGIGKESDGSHTTSSSNGLSVTDNSYLLDNGDYMMWGYESTSTSTTTADLTSGNRWVRDWFLDKTDAGTANGNVTLTFDFSDMGIGGTPLGTYSLMYRSGTSGNYSVVSSSSSLSGDQVSFTVNASSLADGYYTLSDNAATGLNFDATNDYVEVPNSASINSYVTTGEITIEYWIKPVSTGTAQDVIAHRPVANNSGFVFEDNSGGLTTYFFNFAGTWYSLNMTSTYGVWQHIAIVVKANQSIKGYLNGNLIATTAVSGSFALSSDPLRLGMNTQAGINRPFNGTLDEVRIWSRALCQGEIQNNMSCELNPSGQSGLVALYHLNQGSVNANNSTVTSATDVSGNANNGALTGFALSGTTSNWAVGNASGTCSAFTAPALSASSNTPVNAGSTLNLTSTGTFTSWSWSGPNSFTSTLQNPSISNVFPAAAGTYTVTGTNSLGCTNTATTTVVVSSVAARALNFDGVDDYVSLGTSSILRPTSGITFELWAYNSNWATLQNSKTLGSNTASGGYGITFDATTGFVEGIVFRNGVFGTAPYNHTGLSSGWHHFAMSYDVRFIRLYVDGNLVSTNDAGANFNIVYGFSNAFIIGGEASTAATPEANRYFNGSIDEVQFWSRALCQGEIINSMGCELNPSSRSGLLAYYKLNTGFVNANNAGLTTAADSSGNGLNGTLVNMALTGSTSNWTTGNVSGTCAAFAGPVITANASAASVCSGTSVTLSGGGGTSYTWTGGITNGVGFVPSSTTTYTVTGTNSLGCTNTAVITITVNPFPTVVANASATTVCAGTSVTLTGSGTATSYLWTGGITNGVGFAPSSTSTYTVTGTDGNGCSNTSAITVTVNPLPAATATSNSPVSVGGTLNLTGGPAGITTYAWSGPNSFSSASQSPSIGSVTTAASGTYTLTVTNSNGCTSTTTTTVLIQTPATALNFDGVDDYVSLGTSPIFRPATGITFELWAYSSNWATLQNNKTLGSNTASGGYGITFDVTTGFVEGIVFRNGVFGTAPYNHTGLSSGWHHFAMSYDRRFIRLYVDGSLVSTNDAGANFNIVYGFSNAFIIGGEASTAATPEANRYFNGSVDEVQFWSRPLCQGEIINSMSCELNPAARSGLLAYYKLNTGFVNANNAGLTTAADSSGNGLNGTLINMALTGSTSNWTTGIVTGTCSVFAAQPTPIITANGPTTFCSGGSVILNADGSALQFGGISGQVAEVPNNAAFNFTAAESYTLTGWVFLGTVVTGSWQGIITKSRDNTNWFGLWLDPSGHWIYGNTNLDGGLATTGWHHIALVQTGSGSRILYVDGTQVVAGSAVNASATGVLRFGGGQASEPFANGRVDEVALFNTALSSTIINAWKYSSINSSHPNFGNLQGYWKFDEASGTTAADASGNGRNATLLGPTLPAWVTSTAPAFPTYLWSPGGATTSTINVTTSGTYSVTLTGTNGCGSAASTGMTVTVNPLPTVVANASATTVCAGTSVTLTGSGATSYSWSGGVTNGVGFVPSSTTTYTVTGTDANGCQNTAAITLTVNPLPFITAGNNGPVCSGSTLNLSSTATSQFVVLSGGEFYSLGIKADGTLWSWGINSNGELGIGNTTSSNIPVQVGSATNWVSVSGGDEFALGLKSDGSVWAWGYNGFGTLGDGTTTSHFSPALVSGISSGATAIAAGGHHALAIVNGALKSWGYNNDGELGDGTNTQRNSPVQVSGLTSGVTSIAAGYYHSMAVVNGSAKTWGSNNFGQLGDGTTTNRTTPVQVSGLTSGVSSVAGGGYHSLAIVSGSAKSWGYNATGELGNGTTSNTSVPVQVTGLTSGVTTLASGYYHSLAIVNGAVKSWGNNVSGELGDGTNTQRTNPVQVSGLSSGAATIGAGFYHSLAYVSGVAKSWGRNGNGQLGDATTVDRNSAVNNLLGTVLISGNFSWSGPNSFTSSLQNPSITNATTAASGTYTVTITNTIGCSATATTSVTVNPLPSISVNGNEGTCGGFANLGLTGSGTGFVSSVWTGPNGFSSTLLNPVPPFIGYGTYTYTFTATSSAGCTASATTSLIHSANPSPVAGSNSPVCAGSNLSLTASASGATFYQWSGPNGFNSTLQNPVIGSATTAASGTYFVDVFNGSGCDTTVSISVTVNSSPTISCPANTTVNATNGQCSAAVTYSSSSTGTPAPVITYVFTGATTGSGSGNGSGSTFNKGVTTVTLTATNTCGAPTCSFTVTVVDNQPPTISCASNVTINTTSGLCTGTTSLTSPTTSDNCTSIGNAISLDGTDDFIEAGTSFSTLSNYTLEAKVFYRGGGQWVLNFCDGTLNERLQLELNGGQLWSYNQSSAGGNSSFGGGTITINTWYHIAITNNTSAGKTLYINGVAVASNGSTISPSAMPGTIHFNIGRIYNNPYFFNGIVDEVRVWNVVRTPAQLLANMNSELNAQAGLIRVFHMNQGVAGGTNTGITSVTDASGSALNGTLTNSALSGATSNWVTGTVIGGPTISNNAPSAFPIGNTTVTWTATDGAGNTATCNQTVTVVDNQAPVLTCPSNVSLNVITNTCAANYTIADPISDNCTGVTWGYVLTGATTGSASGISDGTNSGSVSFNKGVTTVTLSGTDGTNSASGCSFTVTVVDNQAPTITCAANVSINTTNGLCTGTTTLTVPTASDNCGNTGNGLNFDGNSDNVSITNNALLNITTNITMETWIYPTKNTGTQNVMCKSNCTSANNGYIFPRTDDGWQHFSVYLHIGNWIVMQANFPSLNTWHHVAATYDGSLIKLYLDGNLVNSQAASGGITVNSNILSIGNQPGCNEFFGGTLDEMRIWNVARTQAQIQSTMNSELTAQSGLVASYHFNQGIAGIPNFLVTTLTDASGNNLNGTLSTFNLSGATSNWINGQTFGVTVSSNAPSTYPVGNTTVTWTATDAAGNTATCTQTVTVTDNQPPTITCPANITINCQDNTLPANTGTATATDNCSVISVTYADAITPGSCAGNYIISRTWTATDNHSNVSTCVQTITVHDVTSPTISGIAVNQTIMCQQSPVFSTPTALDNCGSATLTYNDVVTAACGATMTTTRTWTAVDACGNIGTGTQTITSVDNVPPVITGVGGNSTVYCQQDPSFSAPIATDNCGMVTLTSQDTYTALCGSTFATTRTWTATDPCGNTATASQTITIVDNVPPVISGVGPGTSISCTMSPSFSNPTATDACGSVSMVFSDVTANFCGNTQVTTRTWTATDACGNVTTASQTINIVDNAPPVISGVGQNFSVECPVVPVFSSPTATDDCGSAILMFSDVSSPVVGQVYSITRTWTATDLCGNSSTASQIIMVTDYTPPVISGVGASASIQCPAVPNFSTPTVTDDCNTSTMTFVDVTTNGCGNTYTTTRTWTATDAVGNSSTASQTIAVIDNTPPVITCPANIISNCQDNHAPAATGTATATDNCGSASVTFSDVIVPGSCAGNYIINRTWTAADLCGNVSTCSQTILVHDITVPVITCPGTITINNESGLCGAHATYTASVSDNCGLASVVYLPVSGSLFPVGTTPVTIIATDSCGNSSNCTFNVVVNDNTPPVITCPANVTIECSASQLPANTGTATATDNCLVSTITSADVITLGSCPGNFTIARTWTATDNHGNSSTCVQTITVHDVTPPVIACPANISVNNTAALCGANVSFSATATDNCGTVTFTYSPASGSFFAVGTTTVTATATDACGNSSACTFTVSVNDVQPPTFGPSIQYPAPSLALANVSEASQYNLVYSLDIPNTADWDLASQVPYTVNNASALSSTTFSRVAYMMQLNSTWVWVSFDAITGNLNNIGIPADYVSKQALSNMNVFSNSGSVTPGTGISTGNIEFWPNCYSQAASNGSIVTGNNSLFDFNDDNNFATDCYGSFQVHNYALAQTLFAYNAWSTGGGGDLGIGNQVGGSGNPDWTFAGNTSTYATKKIYVLMMPQSCPANMTVNTAAGQCGAPVTYAVNPTDNCSGVTVVRTAGLASGATFPVGTTPVTHVATDASGNTATCSFNITVVDNQAPTITCPAPVIVQCASDVPSQNVSLVTASDNCSAVVTFVSDVISAQTCANHYTITRTYRATDPSGNFTNCIQTITVNDNTPPVITCPSPVTVSCASQVPAPNIGSATATDNCAGAVTITFISDVISNQTCANRYTITRTYRATDACGNFTNCTQTITVNDTTLPTFACPANITVTNDAGQCNAAVTLAAVTATDNCGGSGSATVTNSFNGTSNASGTYPLGITNVIWTATDACGNTSSCTQTVTVNSPEIDVTGNAVSIVDGDNTPSVTDATDFGQPFPSVPVVHTFTISNNGTSPLTINSLSMTGANPSNFVISGITTPVTLSAGGSTTFNVTFTGAGIGVYTSTLIINNTDCNEAIYDFALKGEVTCLPASIACPSNITVNAAANLCSAVVTYSPVIIGAPAPSATYSFTGATSGTGSGTGSGAVFNVGATNVSITVINPCGNQTCSFTVTVIDNQVPVITCPGSITINCQDSSLPANTGTATATDNCSVSGITSSDLTTAGNCSGNYTITRTWTATDPSGNSSSCVQIITVHDITAPVITCPANITINCQDSQLPANTGSATATDNCTASSVITSSDVITAGNCSGNYTITRTWTATDNCGNATSCVQTITVQDITPPVITCPANVTINCQDNSTPSATGSATATDNCTVNPVITSSDIVTAGNCPGNYTISRTWTATDACGNASSCIQTIAVQDITAPIINCPANVTVNCQDNNTSSATGTATATDNCGTPVITQSDVIALGNCPGNYTIARTWTATDNCGNATSCVQTITVHDITAPVITCPANITINCQDSQLPANTGSATATDNCTASPVITSADVITPGSCPSNYTIARTWTATDNCGNATTCIQTITVHDVTPPVIIGVGPAMTIECPAAPVFSNPTTSDICSTVTLTSNTVTTPTCGSSYIITRTWTATDACGNITTASQAIHVEDHTAPVITGVNPNQLVNCPNTPNFCSPIATDACGSATITFADVTVNGCGGSFVRTRTWTAVDGCGNTSTASQAITVQDITAPVISGGGAPSSVIFCPATPNFITPAVTDGCSSAGLSLTFNDVTTTICGGAYSRTRTWTATDGCGNHSSVTRTINVLDNTAPVITGVAANATIACPASPAWITPASTDACGTSVITYADVTTSICGGSYSRTRTWTATDGCGNHSSASRTVTVTDLTPPVISGVGANATITCPAAPVFSNPIASDACGSATIAFNDVTTAICGGSYNRTRTWTATDACGNTSTASQTITVQDITAPVLSNLGTNATIQCPTAPVFSNPIATDACGTSTITFNDVTVNGCGSSYTVTRTWTAADGCGNSSSASRTIIVQDITAPVISGVGSAQTINCPATPSFSIPTALDACGTNNMTFNDVTVNGTCPGNYVTTRTWTATDGCGNSSTASQAITVHDITPPTISCPPTLYLCASALSPALTNATGSDGCSGVAISHSVCPANFPAGTTVITWTATDLCGNTATCTQNVIRDAAIVVSITHSGDISGYCQGNNTATLTANASGGTGALSYLWSNGATTQSISVNSTGTYTVVVTDQFATPCTGTASYVFQTNSPSALSSYTILAKDNVHLHGYNVVQNGGVGATTTTGSAEGGGAGWVKIHDHSTINAITTFARASGIQVSGASLVMNQIFSASNAAMPTFDPGLPANTTNVTVPAFTTVTLNGNTYGNITVGQGATLIFGHATVDLGNLFVGQSATVQFIQVCTKLRMASQLDIDRSAVFNPDADGKDVAVYLKHINNSGSGAGSANYSFGFGSGGGTLTSVNVEYGASVKAFIYAPDGKIDVHGGASGLGATNGNTSSAFSSSSTTTMKGLFIARAVKAHGRTNWNWNTVCSNCNYSLRNAESENASSSLQSEELNSGMLIENFPDPFKDKTNIRFVMEKDTHATVKVYDLNGKYISTIFNGDVVANKEYKMEFDGSTLANGMYIYKVITPEDVHTGKMMLIKE